MRRYTDAQTLEGGLKAGVGVGGAAGRVSKQVTWHSGGLSSCPPGVVSMGAQKVSWGCVWVRIGPCVCG